MSESEIKILVFTVDGENYATDIIEVERILGHENSTKMPDSPYFIDGVINYEGSILPILNLSKRFGLTGSKRSSEDKIIVIKQNDFKIGVIVEEVSEVINVSSSSIEKPPEIVMSISKRYVKGLIKLDGRIIILLDFNTILTEEEKKLI